MTIRERLETIAILKKAQPTSLAALVPYTTIRDYPKGAQLFRDRDEVQDLFLVIDGTIALYKMNLGGDKRGIFIYGPGAALNEVILDGKAASISAEALRDSQVLRVKRSAFLSVCAKDFSLAQGVMESMSMKIRRLYHLLKNTANNICSGKRVAARLWKLSRDHGVPCGQGTALNFDLTITQLAELLGAQRETVSRQVKLLVDQGLLIRDKNRFIIPNREQLSDFFNEP